MSVFFPGARLAQPAAAAPRQPRLRRLAAACTLALVALHAPIAFAALSFTEAVDLARQVSPALRAQQAATAGAQAAEPAAAALPDPRLSVGVENLPVTGMDRWKLTRDFMTMQRVGVMQEMPNRAKREARTQLAQARTERERSLAAVAELQARREAMRAWLAVHYAEQRLGLLEDFRRENRLLLQTLPARIAAGGAQPTDLTMARQETLALDDRQDEFQRDVAKARATLRRLVGPRADEPLAGEPPALTVRAEAVREALHRHVELQPFEAMAAMARAEIGEAESEKRGDWSWEVAYARRPRYDDMVSFQLSFDLPLRQGQRQEPQVASKRRELERVEAEREDTARRHGEEVEMQLAELQALDAQAQRLRTDGQRLAAERVSLVTTAYQAGRSDLGAVLAARAAALEQRLRTLSLDAERVDLRVRLNTLTAE
ncbi:MULTISPECIES: TolC family protein [Azohydromonas]|jgi:outer membrane protein TolC|uniref:TolC family protein n=1 Tax=Azohydromonas lata TaxID=45677 RepID=A0ABU5I9D0_9BURK|nr:MULTISPECIES: TolC family protein [Azohydromonas]MDZ5455712.1 TolC family protein [Azohydromonas lata]